MMSQNNVKIKVNAKEQTVSPYSETTFNQFQFVKDIYECEKQLYILDARLRELFIKRTVGPTDFPKEFKNSVEYKNYCKEYKIKKNFPKGIKKPETLLEYYDDIGNFLLPLMEGTVLGAITDIIIDIIKKPLLLNRVFT